MVWGIALVIVSSIAVAGVCMSLHNRSRIEELEELAAPLVSLNRLKRKRLHRMRRLTVLDGENKGPPKNAA